MSSNTNTNIKTDPHASTLSLISTSGSVSSTTPLTRGGKQNLKGKDYNTAFGALASTFGTSGATPRPPRDSPSPSSSSTPLASAPPAPAPPSSPAPRKDFEAAFANLSQSYGYGGSTAVLPRKDPTKKGADKTKKMSLLSRVLKKNADPE
ncbi:hypothetical protein HWV62_40324 [Athelia sp. TMB]|nr:hypothetical protein HWV62_40324 [Athelia sp. TMB]